MYEFLDRLFDVALPRVRDFRGINPNSFDGRGNDNMGIKEQLIFPEIDYDKIDKVRGMDICLVATANNDEEARELLSSDGRPVCEIRRDCCGQNFYEVEQRERNPKFSSRAYNRCKICGRPHAYLRKIRIPHLFRELAYKGEIPGRKKSSSW